MITRTLLEEAAYDIMFNASIRIPGDYENGIISMAENEQGQLSAFVLESMLENWQAAREDRQPRR